MSAEARRLMIVNWQSNQGRFVQYPPWEHEVVIEGSPAIVTAAGIAVLLAERLKLVLPSGFGVFAQSADVWIAQADSAPSPFGLCGVIDQVAGPFYENVRSAVESVCREVTELVAMELEEDWPESGFPVARVDSQGISVMWRHGERVVIDVPLITWLEIRDASPDGSVHR